MNDTEKVRIWNEGWEKGHKDAIRSHAEVARESYNEGYDAAYRAPREIYVFPLWSFSFWLSMGLIFGTFLALLLSLLIP